MYVDLDQLWPPFLLRDHLNTKKTTMMNGPWVVTIDKLHCVKRVHLYKDHNDEWPIGGHYRQVTL